jgi:hypothetical protein
MAADQESESFASLFLKVQVEEAKAQNMRGCRSVLSFEASQQWTKKNISKKGEEYIYGLAILLNILIILYENAAVFTAEAFVGRLEEFQQLLLKRTDVNALLHLNTPAAACRVLREKYQKVCMGVFNKLS